jgi:hypothetical protein
MFLHLLEGKDLLRVAVDTMEADIMEALREIRRVLDIGILTEAQRHQRSRKLSAKNISPVPSDVSAGASRLVIMFFATELGFGARHKPDGRVGAWEIPRALFASGASEFEGERARLIPIVEDPG